MSEKEAIGYLLALKEDKYTDEILNSLEYVDEEDECYVLSILERQAIEVVLNSLENSVSKDKIREEINKYKDNIKNLDPVSDCALIEMFEDWVTAWERLLIEEENK